VTGVKRPERLDPGRRRRLAARKKPGRLPEHQPQIMVALNPVANHGQELRSGRVGEAFLRQQRFPGAAQIVIAFKLLHQIDSERNVSFLQLVFGHCFNEPAQIIIAFDPPRRFEEQRHLRRFNSFVLEDGIERGANIVIAFEGFDRPQQRLHLIRVQIRLLGQFTDITLARMIAGDGADLFNHRSRAAFAQENGDAFFRF